MRSVHTGVYYSGIEIETSAWAEVSEYDHPVFWRTVECEPVDHVDDIVWGAAHIAACR